MKTMITAILMLITIITAPFPAKAGEPQPKTEQPAPAQEQEAEKQHTATIVTARMGEKYIYMEIEDKGEKIWIATIPSFLGGEVKAGD
ncbi:MAG: hypothetical protein AB1499_01465, partial [Nitrospirota bacterium]